MLKKNMRKRLLAGALATIMALTMCPTWALADNEGIWSSGTGRPDAGC